MNMNRMLRLLIYIVYMLVLNSSVSISYARQQLEIVLHDKAVVNGFNYTLGDIAKIKATDERTREILNSLIIGLSPRVGYFGKATRSDISARIETLIPGSYGSINWHGAVLVKLKRRARMYPASDYLSIARKRLELFLTVNSHEFSIHTVGEYRDLKLPQGELNIIPRLQKKDLSIRKRMNIWLDVHIDNELYRSILIWFSVEAYDNAWVVKRDLPGGYVIDETVLRMQPANLTESKGRVLPVTAPLSGMRLRSAIKLGRVLTEELLEPLPPVFSGQRVQVGASVGDIQLTTFALALEDGEMGEKIQVKKLGSDEKYLVSVIGNGRVFVGGGKHD